MPMPKLSSTSLLLQDTLDVLCSSHSANSDRSSALSSLEHMLATICVPDGSESTAEFEAFLACQDAFECNIPSRIISWISSAIVGLETIINKSPSDRKWSLQIAGRSTKDIFLDCRDEEASELSSHLIQSLSIIQGVALNHKSSKSFLGRKYTLQILLDLLLVSRHLSSPPQTPNHESSSSTVGDKSKRPPSPPQLASAVLDTLLCILVDSSTALRAFEEAKGVQVVVKILKRAGTPREVRMKCLEFLYFYLLDERSFAASSTVQRRAGSESSLPTTVPTTPASPKTSSKSSNDDSEEKLLPAFTFTPGPMSPHASGSFESSLRSQKSGSWLMNSTSSSTQTSPRAPNFSWPSTTTFSQPRTPPRSRTQSGASTKSLLMLRKEVDFVPMTPKKSQIAGLGVGTPLSSRNMSNRKYKGGGSGRGLSPRSEKENKGQTTNAGARIKTTEEKKELLGTMLGNVDALVEGVKKAGIWGLA